MLCRPFPPIHRVLEYAVFGRDPALCGLRPLPEGAPRLAVDRRETEAGAAADGAARLIERLKAGVRFQSLLSLALAVLLLFVSPVAAASSLLGSLAVYLPGLMFTWLTLSKLGGDTAVFLRTAALAELAKLLLTGALSAAVFIFVKPLAPAYFFVGMIATLVAGWIGLARAFQQAEKTPDGT